MLLVIVLLTGGEEDGGQPGEPGTVEQSSPEGESAEAEVVDVVDGDTIEVDLDGVEEDVRYIGIDTPEVDPNIGIECFGAAASAENSRLVEGRRVRLAFDAERRDRYGRLLAYVYRKPDALFFNAALIRGGYARTLTIEPNDRFAAALDRLEQLAANAGRGLWGEC